MCGNGVCEAWGGEDCDTCDLDCNGKQKGPASGRFCCGDLTGAGTVSMGVYVPRPSWPDPFFPHAQTVPSVFRASV